MPQKFEKQKLSRSSHTENRIAAHDVLPYPANETANMKPTLPQTPTDSPEALVADNAAAANGVAHTDGVAPARKTAPATARGRKRAGGFFLLADRYLLNLLIGATLGGLLRFGGLLLVVVAVSSLRKASQEGLPSGAMLEMIYLQMPRLFLFALPMSLLYGTVQVFSDLSGRGEITALWAGGMSLKRMLRAPVVLGATLAITAFFVQEILVPGAESRRSEVVMSGVENMKPIENFIYDKERDGVREYTIQAQMFHPRLKLFEQPSVLFFRDRQTVFEITATSCQWDMERNVWHFKKGRSIIWPTGKDAEAQRYIEEGFDTLEIKPSQLEGPQQMLKKATSRARHLAKGDFEMVSIIELAAYRKALLARQKNPDPMTKKLVKGATYGIHDKIATPLLCLALILVGAPLGLRPQRSSASFATGLSLLVIMFYYLTWTGASYPGKEGDGSPLLLAYLAPGLTAFIGLFLVWKKSR